MDAPMIILTVSGSSKRDVPIIIAVKGSNTPKIEVLVGPILRADMARQTKDIMVGNSARPSKFVQTLRPVTPAKRLCSMLILSKSKEKAEMR